MYLLVLVQEVNGKHLLKAEPLNAILDPQYFVRQVHECVVRVLSERMAREQHAVNQTATYRCTSLFLHTNSPLCLHFFVSPQTLNCIQLQAESLTFCNNCLPLHVDRTRVEPQVPPKHAVHIRQA